MSAVVDAMDSVLTIASFIYAIYCICTMKKKGSVTRWLLLVVLLVATSIFTLDNRTTENISQSSASISTSIPTENIDLSINEGAEVTETLPLHTTTPQEEPADRFGDVFLVTNPNDAITYAGVNQWVTNEDFDIVGNTYDNALKLYAYNIFDAIDGHTKSNIDAEVHLPYGGKANGPLKLTFVVASDMVGNGSFANISILADGNELFSPTTLESTTTKPIEFLIEDTSGIYDLVLKFQCEAVGSGISLGIVLGE